MIRKEEVYIAGRAFVRTYSDIGNYIERDGIQYAEAIDLPMFNRTYTETEEPIFTEEMLMHMPFGEREEIIRTYGL